MNQMLPWCAVRLVFWDSNSLHNLGGQKQLCLCYHARHLQKIHWSKLLCGIYGFTAKLSISRLNICQILMRWADHKTSKIGNAWIHMVSSSSNNQIHNYNFCILIWTDFPAELCTLDPDQLGYQELKLYANPHLQHIFQS